MEEWKRGLNFSVGIPKQNRMFFAPMGRNIADKPSKCLARVGVFQRDALMGSH